ncbi:hypothetical protein MUCCIDRAFT_110741 [Mucor lusitanicus CBS 277.49]|uniref:Uncharacterized protein n=1 Tax=Mucor lusitanicus CBS 277.49 TaxID=747725 RepID=A0A168LRB2_MUCCL|nr:hypothetical protein MUCCIDRAFT_110741 [Mucor lusitanicus CBS 277.49]
MPAASEAQQKQPSVEKKRLLVEGQEGIVEDYWATVEIDYEELDDEDSDQVCLPDSLRSPQRD